MIRFTNISSISVNLHLSKTDLNALSLFSKIPGTFNLDVYGKGGENVINKSLFFREDYLCHRSDSELNNHQDYKEISI